MWLNPLKLESSGYGNVTLIFVQLVRNNIAYVIVYQINFNMSLGQFSLNLKVVVLKLYLKNDKTDPGSYNPIALLPVVLVLGKIIEAKVMGVLVKKHYFCFPNNWFQEKVTYIYKCCYLYESCLFSFKQIKLILCRHI